MGTNGENMPLDQKPVGNADKASTREITKTADSAHTQPVGTPNKLGNELGMAVSGHAFTLAVLGAVALVSNKIAEAAHAAPDAAITAVQKMNGGTSLASADTNVSAARPITPGTDKLLNSQRSL